MDQPLASLAFTSYRCKGRFGWIMIGANSPAEAFAEALRSSDAARRETLEVWNGAAYVPVEA